MKSQNVVREWVNQPVPAILWHYTSSAALMGILSSNRMWADDVLSMNDPEEFIHAQGIVRKVIRRIEQNANDEASLRRIARDLVDKFFSEGALSEKSIQIFVVSFTTLDDDLNQWDRYGDQTRGVSIGFDLSTLRPEIESETLITFAPCVYEDAEKERLAQATIDSLNAEMSELLRKSESEQWIIERTKEWESESGKSFRTNLDQFKLWNQQFFNENVRRAAARCAEHLLRICALCKQRGYRVEQEWRLILPVHKDKVLTTTTRKSRSKGSRQVTYLETRLNFQNIDQLPIRRLMLGPTSED